MLSVSRPDVNVLNAILDIDVALFYAFTSYSR